MDAAKIGYTFCLENFNYILTLDLVQQLKLFILVEVQRNAEDSLKMPLFFFGFKPSKTMTGEREHLPIRAVGHQNNIELFVLMMLLKQTFH